MLQPRHPEEGELAEPTRDELLGKRPLEDVIDPKSGKLLVKAYAKIGAEMARRSEDSVLAVPGWKPVLGQTAGQFDLPDLLRLGGVLPGGGPIPSPDPQDS